MVRMSESPAQAPRSLTGRRKAQTQLDIAHCAAELFADRGTSGVTAEDIATAAGIGLRTFYRYFRTKEEAVTPLLSAGVSNWLRDLAATPAGTPVTTALEDSARRALSPPGPIGPDSLPLVRDLLRAVPGDPALESAWFRIVHDTEESLAEILGALMGPDADPLDVRLTAVAANTAMRLAIQTWAGADAAGSDPTPADIVVRCIRTLTAGLGHPPTV